jgi:hypothetical protein
MAEEQTYFEFSQDHYSTTHGKHKTGSKAPVQFDTSLVTSSGKVVKKLGATTSSPAATAAKMPKK